MFSLTACLLSSDTTSGLSFHMLTAPITTVCLLSMMSCFLPKIPRIILELLLGETIILLCLIDCYCQIFFGSPINPQLLSVVINTDLREAGEFLATFIGYHVFLKWRITLLVLLALFLPISYIPKIDNFFNTLKFNKLSKIIILFVIAICIIVEIRPCYRYAQLFSPKTDIQATEGLIFRQHHYEMSTPMHRMIFAYHTTKQAKKALIGIQNITMQAEIDSCTHMSPHIVLIIGESYNKHHSSLYGYPIATTPLQQKRWENGELFVFKDIVTPWNITSNAILSIFSLWESDSNGKINDYPLFPVLFRHAGYRVNFFSNQLVLRGFNKGVTNRSGNYFLADSQLSNAMFDFRNRYKSNYDMMIANQIKNHDNDSCHPKYSLDIIHLMGQHFEYEKRYPEKEAQFSENEYITRNISDEAKKTVMHYDNATFYNDKVLDELISIYGNEESIVIFISDHGEEMFDDLQVSGRLFQEPTYAIAHQEYEVPMWIWCSDIYRSKHEDIVINIKQSLEKPFVTDGIPQILLYLAGISSEWNNESHNILSPDYQCKKRIISGYVDYDSLH